MGGVEEAPAGQLNAAMPKQIQRSNSSMAAEAKEAINLSNEKLMAIIKSKEGKITEAHSANS